jgi:hypothetical protein
VHYKQSGAILDILYIFNFELKNIEGALSRFGCSLRSIRDQGFNICVSNNSATCVEPFLREIVPDFRYVHKPYRGPFSRAHGINFGVRALVRSEYFMVSDVDLVYQKNYHDLVRSKMQAALSIAERPLRVVFWNYNLQPRYQPAWMNRRVLRRFAHKSSPGNSHDYQALLRLPNNGGGFAHGNGVIHLDSFTRLRGYDENLIGYGPEDDLFNTRIGKVNTLIYDPDPLTASIHLWHPRLRMIQYRKNMKIWTHMKAHYNALPNPGWDDVVANRDGENWGVIE